MSSTNRTWIFVSIISALFIGLGQGFGGREGLLWTLVIVLSVNSYVYFYTEQRILNLFRSTPLEGQDPWYAIEMCKELSRKARIRTPKIVVINSSAQQCFPLGRSWNSSTIVLTKGLLNSFDKDLLKAALAYNIASIKHLNTLSFIMISSVVQFLLSISQSLDLILRWLLGTKKDNYSPQSHLFTYMISPLCSFILKLAISPQSYFLADKTAAHLCGDPKKLAEAIWKLEAYRSTRPFYAPAYLAHLFIVNPLTTKGWPRYFRSQPSMDKRIIKLIGNYPI